MKYATHPLDSERMPGGVPYIVSNEAAERFSYYGMKAILVEYMTKYLLDADGHLAPLSEPDAKALYHLFGTGAYLFPILGAILADAFFGKYRTIVSVSMVYCLGHAALAMGDTGWGVALGVSPKAWLIIGMTLLAIGAGGIKPCVSAHVGDQFGVRNSHLLPKVFGWFYWSINIGALIGQLSIPVLLHSYGPSIAFGLPGLAMALATLVFWMGRHRFVHIQPRGSAFLREVFSAEGLRVTLRLGTLYVFAAMFWALYDQTGSAWVLQAEKLDRQMAISFFGFEYRTEWLASQIQAFNGVLILIFIPLFNYLLYPVLGRFFKVTPLRKIGIGMFLAVPAFLLPAFVEAELAAGTSMGISWQLASYVLITVAEVFLSITLLEFSYTQAPNSMKSFVMALFLASVAVGNLFTALVNIAIKHPDGTSRLTDTEYYLFFSGTMLVAAVGYVLVARRYPERTYIQGSDPGAVTV
jgi:POT family proton-dependent oligopeptide transporter